MRLPAHIVVVVVVVVDVVVVVVAVVVAVERFKLLRSFSWLMTPGQMSIDTMKTLSRPLLLNIKL